MLSIPFNIISCSDFSFIKEKQQEYSYAFRKLYKNFDKITDKTYLKNLGTTYNLDAYMIYCLVTDVENSFKTFEISKNNTEKDIVDIQKELNKILLQKPHTNKEKSKRFNLIKKLNRKLTKKNNSLSKDVVFGKAFNLRQISKFSNKKEFDKAEKYRKLYKENRLSDLYLVGETHAKNSNRFINFDLINNKLVYKPKSGVKIEIEFQYHKNKQKILKKLQEIKDSKTLPLTVLLSSNTVTIVYDEQIVNNYGFNKRKWSEELSKTSDKKERSKITIDSHREQKEKMLKNKIKNRSLAVDLNPEYIGCSICDFVDNKLVVVDKWCYCLTDIIKKSKESSDHEYSKYLNDKRKFEICNVYKDIFEKTVHYKCSIFGMEDLDFKPSKTEQKHVEFNRITKNIWNRVLQESLIKKHCNILGIEQIKVNPMYSSFIGNMMYNYFDPINASIEICRRSLTRFTKGSSIYPEFLEIIVDAMSNRFFNKTKEEVRDDQQIKAISSWKNMYNYLKTSEIKYRWDLESVKEKLQIFSQESTKSKVLLYTFS